METTKLFNQAVLQWLYKTGRPIKDLGPELGVSYANVVLWRRGQKIRIRHWRPIKEVLGLDLGDRSKVNAQPAKL